MKDNGKQQAGTKLGYTATNRKIQLDGGEAVLISGVKPEQLSNAINTKKYNVRNFIPLTCFAFIQRKFILIHLIVILVSIGISDDANFSVDRVQLFALFLAPILISYSVYILLILRVEHNKGIFDRSANERQSLVFNKHRNKLFEADQTVIEQQINLSDKKKWKDIEVGDIVIIYKDEHCPCEVLVLDFQGDTCILDMHQINGNTVYKKIKPTKVTRSKQQAKHKGSQLDFRKMLKGLIEYSRNEHDEIKGYIKLKQDPQVEQFSDENVIPRSAIIKQEWVFGIALYTGLECQQFKHQNNFLNKEKESFFLNKIEFFCIFHYVLLVPIIVQKLIFQASNACYNDIEDSKRFYFKSFNFRQLFITITDSLPLFPIVIYIIIDCITLFEILFQNHEIITNDESNKFVRLKSLAEVKNQRKPVQSIDNGGQQQIQGIASQSQFVTVSKIPVQNNSHQQQSFNQTHQVQLQNFSVIQNNRDKSVSIVNHLNQKNKKNKLLLNIKQFYHKILSTLIEIKFFFMRNFTEKIVYPHFRIREPIPVADLSVTSHVIIGKTNVISYPYSSEVCKVLFGDIQYKFMPEKVAQKYEDYMTKYQLLKEKLSTHKSMKRLGLNFKRKRNSEKTDIMLSHDVEQLRLSMNPFGSNDKQTFYNTLAISEFQGSERTNQLNDSTGKIHSKKRSADKSEANQIIQRSFSLTNLQESPEFRSVSSSRPNLNLNHQASATAATTNYQKKVADSIILEESNHSIKTKIGAGSNTNRHQLIFEYLATRSDRLQSQASNHIRDSDLQLEDFPQAHLNQPNNGNESSIITQKQRGSQSLNHINHQFNNNNVHATTKQETMGSLNRIKHQNSVTESQIKGDASSRNKPNTLYKQKSQNSDQDSVLNISNNQINSLAQYQKNSIHQVRFEKQEPNKANNITNKNGNKHKNSIEFDGEEEIPNEKDSSFKKDYMNQMVTTNQQSAEYNKQKYLSPNKNTKNDLYKQNNNINTLNSLQPETMRHLIEDNFDDGEMKYPNYSKPPSQNSRVLIEAQDDNSQKSSFSEHSIIEQEQQSTKDAIKDKYLLKVNDVFLFDKDKKDKKQSVSDGNQLQHPLDDVDDINEFNDIPSEKLSEKMKQRQIKSISNKFDNSSSYFSLGGEINSEMNESVRLRNNKMGTNLNSIHFSAHKKFMHPMTTLEKETPTSDERDLYHLLLSTSSKKEKLLVSNQSTFYKQRSLSQQFIPHPFAIEEQEEELNKTPLPKSSQKEVLTSSNNSEKQLSQRKKQPSDQLPSQLINKDISRRFSLEESMSRSSRNPSVRFGVVNNNNIKSSNNQNNLNNSNQQSIGNGISRRSSLFKQQNGVVHSEETPRNAAKKSLKIDLSKIDNGNDNKFLTILNKDENTGSNQFHNIPAEIDDFRQYQQVGTSVESPQLGKFMNIMMEKQDSGRKSGSARDINDANSLDSVKRTRHYQLSIHSRDQENQKVERKPTKQFTFQTRAMVSSSIRQEKAIDLNSNNANISNMESHLQENSLQQMQQTAILGQANDSINFKKLETSGYEKPSFSQRFHKKSLQFDMHSSENHYDLQGDEDGHLGEEVDEEDNENNEEDEEEDEEEEEEEEEVQLENEDQEDANDEENPDNEKNSQTKLQNKKANLNLELKIGQNSELTSKNDSINEVKSDINRRNLNDTENISLDKRNDTPKKKKSLKYMNKSTLPKLQIKRESLEMSQLSARLNFSPSKAQSNKFYGNKNSKIRLPSNLQLSDSNKSSRSTSVNFNKLQGFQDHSIPKDMDKFLEHYIKEGSSNRKQIRNSLKCMVLCHQTVTKFDIDKNQLIHTFYNEEEEMILRFTKNLGYIFKLQNLKQNEEGSYQQEYIIQIQQKIKKYEVIAFHRRKFRFSILVKRKNGSDLIMREELKTVPLYVDFQRDLMAKIIHKNMQNGFRSVLISKYSLNKEETHRFVNQLGNLQTNIVKEREAVEKLFAMYEEKESSMQFVTLLGVREKLREKTDIFLNSLYNNKIKTWMLTGEQYTRALSSAYLSQIVKPEDQKNENNLINIHFESPDYDDIKYIIRRNLEKVQVQLLGEDQEKNSAFHNKDKYTKFQRNKSKVIQFAPTDLEQQLQFQIIIKGDVLRIILEDSVYLKSHFLFLCHFCKGFVAYEADSDTKQMLLKALKEQESHHRFLAITNDRGLSNTAHFSIEIENPQNSCSYVADACIDSFQDLYKLVFLHGRRQADFINIILNFQVYRQLLYYIVSLITEDSYCTEGENPMNQVEITVFNYILNFFSIIPLFIQYFNPKDPEKLVKNEDDNLKYYASQYQTTKNFWSKTQITTYSKLVVAALIQAMIIFFGMDQILQSIQNDGKLIGFEETRMVTFIMIMVVTQVQIIYFSSQSPLIIIIYQVFIFLVSTVIYLTWKSIDNTMFRVLAELFQFPAFFFSFLFFSTISCFVFEFLHILIQIVPFYLVKDLDIIYKAINFFENSYSILRASRLADSKRDKEKTQTNHLSLLGIIRQYFNGQTEIDEIVLSMMNTGIGNIHTGISKYTQRFDNPEFEQKYIKRTIGHQIYFSKAISLILFFTLDIFLLVLIVTDDMYTNGDKVVLITFIAIVLFLTLLKWYRYEQCFIIFNYGLILARVGYLIAAIQIINDYDNFLIMLVFMYILYFVQLVRMDIVVAVYTFFALYDSINFVIGIQKIKFSFSKEYIAYYIINALTLISAFTYLLVSQKYKYGMMDRQQYLSANKLQLEMQKFNEVLSILLPKFIRDQIQSDNQSVVKIENQVSIIFCDIYNFDDIIAKKNVEVIKLLDNLYRAFDILCNLNGLQKIETVGKTYMACGGIVQNKLQQREGQYSEFNEVKCAINFAFEILEYSSTLTFGDDGEKILLKIGIHFGSVIAGVIGYHKPQFSLIGDTVNTTSRVCSTSDPGTVTLSEQAYERVKECDVKVQQMDKLDKINEKFRINDAKQKKVEAKGKGELITYQVQKYKTKKYASPDTFLPQNRDRIAVQSFQMNAIKLEESPQSEKFPNNTDQNSVGDQPFDTNDRNTMHALISPQQQLRQKQTQAIQQQLSTQQQQQQKDTPQDGLAPKENGIIPYQSNTSINILQRNSGQVAKWQQTSQTREQLMINLDAQIQVDNQSYHDGTYSRHYSNLQVTPQGQRISLANQSMIMNTPDAMIKSSGSKISISHQNAMILGHTTSINNGGQTNSNNHNLSIPGYTQTNSVLNYQNINNNSNMIYSPNLLAIRAEKSDTNAQELISNIDGELRNKLTSDHQQRSHNFSISHFEELKSQLKNNVNADSIRMKIPLSNQNDDNFSQKVVYNNSAYLNGKSNQNENQSSPSKNVSAVAQKIRQAENMQKKNISKNIANLLITINNNEAEDLTPSIDSKKIASKVHSSAESRKNTSNNTLPKHDDILPPFSNSGSVALNHQSSGNRSNSGNIINLVVKLDPGQRKKSIFNPNSNIGVNMIDQIKNMPKQIRNKKHENLKPPPGFNGYDKMRHTVYANTNIQYTHNTLGTPQSKTSLHKLHQIQNLQNFSDLVNNQLPYESSGGGNGASTNKISGNSILKRKDERKEGQGNSKSHTEFEMLDSSVKSHQVGKLSNTNSILNQNGQLNNQNTPYQNSPQLKKKSRTPESTLVNIPQNNVSTVQNFLSKGIGQSDQHNASMQADSHHLDISPPVQKRKSFFYNNNNMNNNIQNILQNTPPFQTRSHRVINMANNNNINNNNNIVSTNTNGKGSHGNLNQRNPSQGTVYQSISSSMQHLPDTAVKIVIKNIRDMENKMGMTPMTNRNKRRGSSAQNIKLPSNIANEHKVNGLKNNNNNNNNNLNTKKQFSQQNSLNDNKSVYSKQSSNNEKFKKNLNHCISQEEKSSENLFNQATTAQNQHQTDQNTHQTQQTAGNNLLNQINIQLETSPNSNQHNRKDSTNKYRNQEGNNNNVININNNNRSSDTTPKNKGRLTPQGLQHRSSSNTGNQSQISSNTPNESQLRKINQNDLSHQGYLNQFTRNGNQIDNLTNASIMKRMTLEKRLTEYTIRSKSNTKSSKYTLDTKSPALTHLLNQQVNSQVQLDNEIEQIMEEEEQQAKEDQESIISSEKKLIFFEYQEINEKIIAEGKYGLENQIDPSNLRKVYDEQEYEDQEERKIKKKDQNDQFILNFKDVFPIQRKLKNDRDSDTEFELSKDFFAQQIQKSQDSSKINLWIWLIIYVLKTISFLVVREKLISVFILMVVFRTIFIIAFAFFLYKMRFIFNMWNISRIKQLIYIFFGIQYLFFYIETSFMILTSSNTFSSNLQTAEQFFSFVIFTEFIFQYYSEKILICLTFILSEILLSIFKEGYFRLMTLLSITIFSSLYHLIMHYIILSFQISNFNDIRNLEFKRLLYKRFLYNLLPSHIMGQLLSQQPDQQIELTDSLENTTLLFADIAGFTNYCSGKDPEKVLYMLQKLFVCKFTIFLIFYLFLQSLIIYFNILNHFNYQNKKEFDKASIDNEVYKVYTIGDCYVVMGTLNAKQRKPSIEAKNVINMAFSMIKAIDEAKQKEYSDIDMRIGIHTGDIIGGVIGTDIVRYDIYGPNVLIANKMESGGERGRIMISETTYKLVKGSFPNSFNFQEREEDVIIKSLNNLQVKAYFVSEKNGDNNDYIQPQFQGFQDQAFIPYNPEESGEYYENDDIDHDEEYYTQQEQQYDEENYEEGQQYEDDDEDDENDDDDDDEEEDNNSNHNHDANANDNQNQIKNINQNENGNDNQNQKENEKNNDNQNHKNTMNQNN